jgi:hypothetical protein
VSSKKSTRSTPSASRTPKKPQPEATATPPVVAQAPAPAALVSSELAANPQPASKAAAKPATKPASKLKAKPAGERAAKPKTSDLAPLTPRAARARTTKADLPVVLVPPGEPTDETPTADAVRVVTDEDIRIRAYFLSLEHRARGGSDIDFWLIAERELRSGTKPKD